MPRSRVAKWELNILAGRDLTGRTVSEKLLKLGIRLIEENEKENNGRSSVGKYERY